MEEHDDGDVEQPKHIKKGNILPLWGNERTMNMNPLILTNIQSSHYFKVNLYELKTYHEVIDEIYYKVSHLEPWEKGSRKTSGQTGMCGGVRGVGAGGIVSTAYCLLYKLFTLRLTRKQLNGLINHTDSPYIRALGFMYIRYTQPPADLYDWYDEYLEDTEEMDVRAGGGQVMTIGEILRAFLTKLDWFSTLFPRIPVPIQQKIEKKMNERFPPQPPIRQVVQPSRPMRDARTISDQAPDNYPRSGNRGSERWNDRGGSGGAHRERERSPIRDRERHRDRYRDNRDEYRRDRYDQHRDPHRTRDPHGDRGSHRDRGRDRDARQRDERSHHHHR